MDSTSFQLMYILVRTCVLPNLLHMDPLGDQLFFCLNAVFFYFFCPNFMPVLFGLGTRRAPDAGGGDGERAIPTCSGAGTGYHNPPGMAPLPSLLLSHGKTVANTAWPRQARVRWMVVISSSTSARLQLRLRPPPPRAIFVCLVELASISLRRRPLPPLVRDGTNNIMDDGFCHVRLRKMDSIQRLNENNGRDNDVK